MPFTANRQFKQAPRMLAKSSGMHYWTPEGRQVLDGAAGLDRVRRTPASQARAKVALSKLARRISIIKSLPNTFQSSPRVAMERASCASS